MFRIIGVVAGLICALLVGKAGGIIIGLATGGLTVSIWLVPFAMKWWRSQRIHFIQAESHMQAGNWGEAERWYRAIADVAKQPSMKADMLAGASLAQVRQKKYTEAEATIEEGLRHAKQPGSRAKLLRARAEAQVALGDAKGAAESQKERLKLTESATKDPKAIAVLYGDLGQTLMASEPRQAVEVLQKALELTKKAYGEAGPETGKVLQKLAEAYLKTGDAAGAVPVLQESVKLLEETLTIDSPEFMAATERLAEAYDAAGDDENALRHFERAVSLHERHVGKSTPEFITALMYLGAHHCAEGNYARAMEYARTAHSQMGITRDPRINEGLELLAIVYEQSGRPEEAAEFRKRKAATA